MRNVRIEASREGVRTLCIDRETIVTLSQSDDAREGIDAFFEQRRPVWKGR